MTTISRNEIVDDEFTGDGGVRLLAVDHVASYNWIEAKAPTIAVPGCPAVWLGKRGTQRVPRDSGWVMIAQNAARHPESPLEPLFRSVLMMRPQFDFNAIDIVSDRNNLRKLLTFIDPSSTKYAIEPFTINLEVVKDTVIFARTEKAVKEFIGQNDFRGFGHEFEKANTAEVIQDSTGHHRIINYQLGNLELLVRYEVDGYVESKKKANRHDNSDNEDELTDMMNALTIGKDVKTNLTIYNEGKIVNPSSTLELKTRAAHRPMSVADVAPQLWLSSTSKLVRAYHNKGLFAQPSVEDVSSDIKKWERQNQCHLSKLVSLLNDIKEIAFKYAPRSTLSYDPSTDRITIAKKSLKPFLPKDIYKHWAQ